MAWVWCMQYNTGTDLRSKYISVICENLHIIISNCWGECWAQWWLWQNVHFLVLETQEGYPWGNLFCWAVPAKIIICVASRCLHKTCRLGYVIALGVDFAQNLFGKTASFIYFTLRCCPPPYRGHIWRTSTHCSPYTVLCLLSYSNKFFLSTHQLTLSNCHNPGLPLSQSGDVYCRAGNISGIW